MPVSFKVRLFKCFLDAAVSEQIARMVAMGGATKNADDLVKSLTRQYNRARQTQITRELADIVGGAAALEVNDRRPASQPAIDAIRRSMLTATLHRPRDSIHGHRDRRPDESPR